MTGLECIFTELHEIVLGGREVHSVTVDRNKLLPNTLDECIILRRVILLSHSVSWK